MLINTNVFYLLSPASLDLGGGSTQIATECLDGDSHCEENSDLVFSYDLYGSSFDVFSSSLLCYGLEETLRLNHCSHYVELNDVMILFTNRRYSALLAFDNLASIVPGSNSVVMSDPCANTFYSQRDTNIFDT